MPAVERITGVCLAGKAFADTLMVIEFLNNFGTALGFSKLRISLATKSTAVSLNGMSVFPQKIVKFMKCVLFLSSSPFHPVHLEFMISSGSRTKDIHTHKCCCLATRNILVCLICKMIGQCCVGDV